MTVCEHRQGAVDWFELVNVVSEVGCTSCRSQHTGHAGKVVTACQTTRADWTCSNEGHDCDAVEVPSPSTHPWLLVAGVCTAFSSSSWLRGK